MPIHVVPRSGGIVFCATDAAGTTEWETEVWPNTTPWRKLGDSITNGAVSLLIGQTDLTLTLDGAEHGVASVRYAFRDDTEATAFYTEFQRACAVQ